MSEMKKPKEIAPAKLSATLILMRDSSNGPEILLTERPTNMSFAAGNVVFPGGKVDKADFKAAEAIVQQNNPLDDIEDAACRIAALRELEEETALSIAQQNLEHMAYMAHWITPIVMPKRFSTHFYLFPYEGSQTEQLVSPNEVVRLYWQTAEEALANLSVGKTTMMFPTRLNIELIARFSKVEEALAFAHDHPVVPVLPEVYKRDGSIWARIPEEAGYGVTEFPRDDLIIGH